ncbi:GntR family transcriptional regulator [Burkholderia pseudomallei]|uniref:GntR family transcriptional regulator n=1 Tax=Burkholderia pseudomallei TaxID=28450 RepID=UPI000F0DB8CD|nr:GntR family transcriptional regulator [Burkholderia pseudomallei]CAJ2918751.1 GntR family transcriptional regulator [Burkholderia pseudomallei]CAJ2940201.1 GntR family transcriptional regulator [Burkholderia pseudomallei]CAJ3013639.1 GntR family transcriptional regulator [Burkholderia pseudomallei]VBC74176.1 GntR family transcriptional regulator [Burkholderia pseudomallei]VCC89837.1 GntR family transcriptional regulator [Burkholderia pseudomallei]
MSTALPSLKVERRATTLRELALEKMRTAILEAHFQPGERLVERSLCEGLGVSRTVVREVLRHLEAEGLVDSIPSQGPIVAVIDSDTAAQIYEIRALLESDAAMACARQADSGVVPRLAECITGIERAFEQRDHQAVRELTTTFYEAMFRGGGRNVAWEIVQTLNARINRLRAMTIASEDRGRQAVAEMNLILDAIRAHDARRARDAATAHVARVAVIAAQLLQRSQEPPPPREPSKSAGCATF